MVFNCFEAFLACFFLFGWPFTATPVDDDFCSIISLTSTQAVVKTYSYHVISNLSGTTTVNQNYPAIGFQTNVAISIYTYDPTAVGIQEQVSNSGTNALGLFPNPANNEINFSYSLAQKENITFEIFDIAGQIVKTVSQKEEEIGVHTETISTENLANGVYFIRLTTKNGIIDKKFIVCRP